MGRPKANTVNTPKKEGKLVPSQVAAALKKTSGIVSMAARTLGCERGTVYDYIKKYPEVQTAFDESREVMLDLAESKLFQAVNDKAGWAICFFLKTQGKSRGYSERREVTGIDGGPVQTNDIGLTDEKRIERITAILNAGRARRDGRAT